MSTRWCDGFPEQSSVCTVFFFRVSVGRDSMFSGLHGIFWAGLSTQAGHHRTGPFPRGTPTPSFVRDVVSTGHHGMVFIDRGIPRDVLRGLEHLRDTTGRDSVITGLHGMSRSRDPATTGRHSSIVVIYCIPGRSIFIIYIHILYILIVCE